MTNTALWIGQNLWIDGETWTVREISTTPATVTLLGSRANYEVEWKMSRRLLERKLKQAA